MKKPVVIIALILIVAVAIKAIDNHNKNINIKYPVNEKKDKLYDRMDAYILSQKYVEKLLKAPKTAEFPALVLVEDNFTYIKRNTYRVVAYVDSENSFGAMLRKNYTCIVEFYNEDGNEKYRITDFNIE